MKLAIKIFFAVALIYCIDALILTPLALQNPELIESNPYQAIGYNRWGIAYFYFSMPLFLTLLFVLIKGVEKLGEDYIKDKRMKNYPLFAFLITWVLLMGYTIIHNIGVLIKYGN